MIPRSPNQSLSHIRKILRLNLLISLHIRKKKTWGVAREHWRLVFKFFHNHTFSWIVEDIGTICGRYINSTITWDSENNITSVPKFFDNKLKLIESFNLLSRNLKNDASKVLYFFFQKLFVFSSGLLYRNGGSSCYKATDPIQSQKGLVLYCAIGPIWAFSQPA